MITITVCFHKHNRGLVFCNSFRIRELIVSCFKSRSLSVFRQASIRWAAVPGHLREMSLV